MAHKSLSRLDAFEITEADPMPAEVTAISGDLATEYRTTDLTPSSSSVSPADVALDLVLTEMLQQARLASSATGTAIGLLRDSEIIVRAAVGATAAEVASYLQRGCKIVDACLRSGDVQRCDDTEADPRFDAAACKRLGLRSVLVAPIANHDKKTIGVVEIFSSRLAAFSDRDVLMLQAISRRVVHNMEIAQKVVHTPAIAAQPAPVAAISQARAITQAPKPIPTQQRPFRLLKLPHWRSVPIPKFDSKLFLLVSAITLSLILGWMLGRVHGSGLRKKPAPQVFASAQRVEPRAPVVASPGIPTVNAATEEQAPVHPALTGSSDPALPEDTSMPGITITRQITTRHKKSPSPVPPSVSADNSADSLVIFEDTQKESSSARRSQASSANRSGVAEAEPASPGSVSGATIRIPASQAEKNLLKRVEPTYPQQARAQDIEGSVVLDIIVDKEGTVHGISTISGDPQLALAAARAVQQWRFKPWIHQGRVAQFETRITVNFAL